MIVENDLYYFNLSLFDKLGNLNSFINRDDFKNLEDLSNYCSYCLDVFDKFDFKMSYSIHFIKNCNIVNWSLVHKKKKG